jgi:hypothetical protein
MIFDLNIDLKYRPVLKLRFLNLYSDLNADL